MAGTFQMNVASAATQTLTRSLNITAALMMTPTIPAHGQMTAA